MLLKQFSDLPPRKRVGIVAIVLGVLAVFIGNPYDNATAKVNIKEIMLLADNSVSTVEVDDLANWIITGKMDYRLVDLRESEEYNEYTIPLAESIPVDEIVNSNLAKNEKIILFGDNDQVASQAWFVLRASNFKGAYILKDGLDAWKNKIVFPECTCGDNPSEEQKHLHAKKAEISKFFGGTFSEASSSNEKKIIEMPKLQTPAKVELKRPKKRKREGC